MTPSGQKSGITFATAMKSEYQPIVLTLAEEGRKPAAVSLEILPHGLTIHRFVVQADGKKHDIVVGPEDPQDHEFQKYTNSIIGRYTNRIPVGGHMVGRRSMTSKLSAQPNESPTVSLHGGPKGFDAVEWTHLSTPSDAELFTQAEQAEISKLGVGTYSIFRLESPDADQGYPGKLAVEVLVALIPPGGEEAAVRPQQVKIGSVVIIYRAMLDEKGKKVVTPINLTQHWGFNLDASLEKKSSSVRNHKLTIRSDKVAALDEHRLPTGSCIKIAGEGAHLHLGKIIGDGMPDKGYDDYYLFEGIDELPPSAYSLSSFTPDTNLVASVFRLQGRQPVVELASELSGISLCFQTNQHGVMFYSFNSSDPVAARKKIHGGSGVRNAGDSYEPTSAAFLEFHNPLAAFLYPINTNRQDTLLTSEEFYHNYVRCDVYFSR